MIIKFKPKNPVVVEDENKSTLSKEDVGYRTIPNMCVTCWNFFWDEETGEVGCSILSKDDNEVQANGTCRKHCKY